MNYPPCATPNIFVAGNSLLSRSTFATRSAFKVVSSHDNVRLLRDPLANVKSCFIPKFGYIYCCCISFAASSVCTEDMRLTMQKLFFTSPSLGGTLLYDHASAVHTTHKKDNKAHQTRMSRILKLLVPCSHPNSSID